MNDIKQIDIKIFANDAGDVNATEFVAVLQRWIQQHTVPGVLIDVADYAHMHHGPGIILVAHEYNLGIDYAEGRMGLHFHYKLPPEETFAERLQAALTQAFTAARLLEQEDEFKGRLSFDPKGFRFMVSDRLHAPNDDATYNALAPHVEGGAKAFYGGDVSIQRVDNAPNERITIDVTANSAVTFDALATV